MTKEIFKKQNYFILTGAPGVGKTTLLKQFAKTCQIESEPAREVIAHERGTSGQGLWEKDRRLFIEKMVQNTIEKYLRNLEISDSEPVIFDRGLPDLITYADLGMIPSDNIYSLCRKYRYNNLVFLFPPWEEIYTTDDERTMDFLDTLEFHKRIEIVYGKLGYQIVKVPKDTIEARFQFIVEKIQARITR